MARQEQEQRAGYCRQCGERLPLIKRVKREEFCSDEHRERYLNSTQSVALSRLQELALMPEPELAEAATDGLPAWGAAVMRGAESAVAVAEPAEPPMAGSIVPGATGAPFRLATVEGGELWLGQLEPLRPEPELHSLGLHFGLAEFHAAGPETMNTPGAVLDAIEDPAEPSLSLAMPGVAWMLAASIDELGAAEGLLAPVARPDPVGRTSLREARAIVPAIEDPDLTIYLPEFSPSAAAASLRPVNLDDAGVLMLPRPEARAGQTGMLGDLAVGPFQVAELGVVFPAGSASELDTEDIAIALSEPEPVALAEALEPEGEAMAAGPEATPLIEPETAGATLPEPAAPAAPLEHATELATEVTPELVAELDVEEPVLPVEHLAAVAPAASLEIAERIPAPDVLVPITERAPIAEESMEEFLSRLAPIAAAVKPREERGMSEGLDTISGGISSEGLGTRFAQPFLHEPAPRAGSAKPRWTPATVNMGSAAEVMTEDWDIL